MSGFAFSQWQVNPPYDAPVSTQTGPEPYFRDKWDAGRSAFFRTPESEYPDGYLGTIEGTRRDDKLMEFLGKRDRSYQRGVHKGERIDPQDYVWPAYWNNEVGLQAQARGERVAPVGTPNERLVAEGKMPVPRGAGGVITVDRARAEQLRRLAPSWR